MQSTQPITDHSAIDDKLASVRQHGLFQMTLANQAFWVTIVVLLICAATAWQEPVTFPTKGNFFNITRNFAPIGIMAMGMIAVIITGGIDLSVGSVMALVAVAAARVMEAGWPWFAAVPIGLLVGVLAGAVNGGLIAYVRLPAFVVTLGMLSIARSLAIVLSENRVIYQFGTAAPTFKWLGGGRIELPWLDGGTLPVSNLFVVLIVSAIVFALMFKWSRWGRYLYAIGGNEQAARLTGIPVDRIKMQAYMLSGLMTAIAALMIAGWLGSASNGMGKSYELYVIAAAVIGGVSLLGGEGGAYAGVIGAALIFLIRNSLIMFGVDANWYDLFVGLFIILAVLLQKVRGERSG